MEETKKKRGRRSTTAETETTNDQDAGQSAGNNAEPDVTGPSPAAGPVQYFTREGDDGSLPLPRIGEDNAVGRLADVAFASGYFHPATPAQLALRILVGSELGLSASAALFDIELGPGSVGYKRDAPAQTAGDRIELVQAETRRILDNADSDVSRSDNAAGDVVPFRSVSTEVRNAIYDAAGGDSEKYAAGIDAAERDLNPEHFAEANNGPVLSTEPEPDAEGLEPKQSDPGPESGEAAADLTPTGDDAPADDLGFPTTEPTDAEIADAIANFDSPEPEPVPAADPFESKATTNPEILEGIEVGATIAVWRKTIDEQMRDLGFPTDKVVAKKAEFDAATTLRKKQMAEQCNALYLGRLGTKRTDVLLCLAKDGKKSVEEMAGFFTYAEVPADPQSWNYSDAAKAFRLIEKELPNLLLDPEPEPATPAAA